MSDYFFYDLNKKMADLASKQQLTENAATAPAPKSKLTEAAADYSAKKAAAGKDIGKPGKNFSKIAAGAAKRYGSAEAGKRVAGAVLNKLRHPTEEGVDESAFQAAIGKKKYGDQGMKALQKAGRNNASNSTMNNIRNRYDKYDESQGMVDEGSKPDFLDLDKDGDRKEPMKSAARGAKKEVDEAAKWRQGYSASGHPAGYKHKSGEVGPIGGTFTDEPSSYDGDYKKIPVQKHRDKEDELAGRAATKLSTDGKPLLTKNAQKNLKTAITKSKGKHGPVGNLPEQGVAEGDKKPYPKTWHDVDPKLGKQVDKMSQAEKVKKGLAHPDTLKKSKEQGVAEAGAPNAMAPMNPDGATAPPAKGKDGQYPFVTSGPNKGKRWSPNTPGPTNPSMKEGGIPMTPKQQKFAKLAPPVDKITFADKIVGAKKEVDEVLGDVAAKAMKKAVASNWANLGSEYQDRPMKSGERRRTHTGGEIEQTAPGVTRHHAGKSYSGSAHDDSADSSSTGSVGRRKVGAGMGKKIGAKINTGKSKLMTREGDMDPADQGEYDQEGSMAKDDIKTVVRHAQALEKILGDNDNLPEWVQAKLAKIEGMMTAVDDYMQNQQGDDEGSDEMEMDEESTNKRDSRAEKAGKKVAKDIEYDEKKKDGIHGKRRDSEDDNAERAGKKVTKDIEYDEKKKDKKKDDKKEVDETTSSGSVATSSAAPKSGGSMSYGKGIYDSLDREVEKMIAESMSINMSMNNDAHGGPSNTLTVTATDEDALQLAMLLKSAGLGSQEHGDMSAIHDMDDDMSAIHAMDHDHGDEPCPACGSSDCECDEVQEAYGDTDATQNEPDWPTDQEGSDDAMMYSGGLDGPKSTGQTTVPVISGQHDRMGYNGDHELRRMMEIAGFSR